MHVDPRGLLPACSVQHRRPEERVVVHDVLADEVHEVAVGVRAPELLHPAAVVLTPLVGAREVPDRRIQPDVEVLRLLAGNPEPEVRRVAGDVPVAERLRQPLVDEVADLRLQAPFAARPAAQPFLVLGELDEVVRRGAPFEVGVPADGAAGILQLGGLVRAAAVLAGIAVLVLGPADGALASDVPVGEEPLVDRAVHLLDVALLDGAIGAQRLVDAARVLLVLR